jgi:hypothetical protein
MAARAFIPVGVGVLTVSDTRTLEDDQSGALAVELLEGAGHQIAARAIVKDNRDVIRAQLVAWIADPAVEVSPRPAARGARSPSGSRGASPRWTCGRWTSGGSAATTAHGRG